MRIIYVFLILHFTVPFPPPLLSPYIGVEFSQKMKVQSAVGDDVLLKPDQYLPKAHTCFFSINLPRYRYSSRSFIISLLFYLNNVLVMFTRLYDTSFSLLIYHNTTTIYIQFSGAISGAITVCHYSLHRNGCRL